MAIYASAPQTDYEFEPAPAGTHQAVCIDVIDLGVNELNYSGEITYKHQVRIVWQIAETMDDGRRFTVNRKYNLSLHRNATLRKDLKSWRGRDFTDDELKRFDVETVIGANCVLSVSHNEYQGKTYANVDSVSPVMKGMKKLTVADDYVRRCERDDWTEPSHEMPSAAQQQKAQQAASGDGAAHPLEDGDDGLPF